MQHLIWSGYSDIGTLTANIGPCQYNGSTHLCMFNGNQLFGYARGSGIILNTDYEVVKTVRTGGDVVAADQHEFTVLNDGASALLTIYQQETYDLSHVGVNQHQGWILDSLFQEINMTDGSVIFEWSALSHVDPFKTYVYPRTSDIAGDGLGPMTSWDSFHINSVDKSNLTGNYIISARHMSTIYNINGTDGSIVWRLQAGGDTDFLCEDFKFAFQHDAQIRAENETHMTMSLYDNASNNYNHTHDVSTGKIITLDYSTLTAKLSAPITEYPRHQKKIRSASQGNMQVLNNGNIVHGYGSWPFLSEHTPDGKAVLTANFGHVEGKVMSYRVKAGDWHSVPSKTRPSLWTFAQDADAPLAMYVSWNGCTEIEFWNFYGADDEEDELTRIGSARKIDFETIYQSETHFTWIMAEAIGFDGVSLRNSSLIQTFIPSAQLATSCTDLFCPGA